jgi:hypothetical protein
MKIQMKRREDDTTGESGETQQEGTGETGKYYYDDSTDYEVFEPNTTLEEDELSD